MDEDKILKNFARALGPAAQKILDDIEEKKNKEKKILESFASALGPEAQKVLDAENERARLLEEQKEQERLIKEEQRQKEKKLLEELNKSLNKLIVDNEDHAPVIEKEIIETIASVSNDTPIQEDLQQLPQIPVRDIVTPGVVALSVAPQQDVQKVADAIPNALRKELDIIKKSVADFHRFAQRHSQMGGGGEVNLRYLDDVDRNSIFGGNFLKYNALSKKFEFANVTSDGVDWRHVPSDIIPNAQYTYNLGNTAYSWANAYVQSVNIPTGTIISGANTIDVIVAPLVLASVIATSNSQNIGLNIGDYGLLSGFPAPWTVYQFTTNPSPVLEIGDVISGAGVPLPSHANFIGSGANAAIVIANTTLYNISEAAWPQANQTMYIVRPIVNPGLVFSTGTNTDITINPGAGGVIIPHADIIPFTDKTFYLGTPTKRFKGAFFGSNTVFVLDETTGVDIGIGAANNLLYISGSAGIRVGEFTLRDNQIAIANNAREILFGSTLATGNVIFNRPIVVKSYDTGNTTFSVTREGRVSIFTPTIPANDIGALSIIGSSNGAYQGVVNPGGMLQSTGNDGIVSRITNDAFGTGAFPAYVSRAARGTANTPSAILSGDILSRYSTVGWGTTNFAGASVPAATNIEVYARENFTDTAGGTEYRIYTAPIGSTTKTLSAVINSDQTTLSKRLVVSGDTTINGNLVVTGSTLYANVENALIANLVLTLAYNSPTPELANGAGLLIDNTSVTWLYNYSANSWQSNVSIVPYFTDTYNIGLPTLRWNTVFAKTANVDVLNSNNIYSNTLNLNTLTVNSTATFNGNTIFNANVVTNANLVVNTATFTSNVYIGNYGNTVKLHISGGANDTILVSDGANNLVWTPRHLDGGWTPNMIPATGSNVIFTVNHARYVKVGPVVTAHFDITANNMGTASGPLKMGGLPFLSISGATGEYEGTISMGWFANLNIADAIHFTGAVIQNSNTADLWLSRLNGQNIAQNYLLASDLKVSSRFVGTVIYSTDF